MTGTRPNTMRSLLLILAAAGVLGGSVRLLPVLPCWLVILPMAVVAGVIGHGLFEFRKTRRRAWARQYLREDGALARWVRPGLLMRFVSAGGGFFLAILLLVQLHRWAIPQWGLLALNIPVFLFLAVWARRRLEPEVRPQWLEPLSRVLAVRLNVAILTPFLVILDLFAEQTDYRGQPYERVLETVAASPGWNCHLLDPVLRAIVYVTELSYWAMQNLVGSVETGGSWVVVAWILLFLASLGAAWTWSRLLMGLCYFAEGR
ncbi:hypothetical protein [Thioalkalivibrio sp. ALJ24]|uniref:hypothetical protein n=1 Tax=Thioalkalivibrio sp. ALJ24 TaxID=545276 RepID=UPI00036A04CA|nr:hypothetical protein [Thioalkalivibrio sp. ALJ24]